MWPPRSNCPYCLVPGIDQTHPWASVRSLPSYSFLALLVRGMSIPNTKTDYRTSVSSFSRRTSTPREEAQGELAHDLHITLLILIIARFPRVGYYIWPSFLIWAIDRLLRCLRIIVFNSHNFNPFGNATQKTALDAAVDVLSPYFLRITLRRPERFRWLPGQSAYLTIPSVSSLPFEAHPFTISTIDIPPVADVSQDELGEKNSPSSSEANLRSDGNLKKIVMFIRVRRGFSERLLNAASRDPGRKFTAYLDGPYGSPPLIRGSHTIVLVAGGSHHLKASLLVLTCLTGGSGIAFTLPLLLDLIQYVLDSIASRE